MGKVYEVRVKDSVYARTGPKSWCIGNLFNRDRFEIKGGTDRWAWGIADGRGFKGYCWTDKAYLHPRPPKENASHGERFHIGNIAAAWTLTHGLLEPHHKNPHLTVHVEVIAGRATLYGNYWPSVWLPPLSNIFPFGGNFHDPLRPGHPLHRGHGLGWRYTTKDRQAAMVFDYKRGLWGFIHRNLIEKPHRNKYFHEFAKNHSGKNKFHHEPHIVHSRLA